MPRPRARSRKEYIRKRTEQLIHEGYDPKQAYAIANSEARKMWLAEAAEMRENPVMAAVESPTRDPWVVAVRTSEPEKVERTAGLRGQRTKNGVWFVFYDDERAASLARTLTRAGHIVTWGPETSVAAEESAAKDCDHSHPASVPTKPCAGESKLSSAKRKELEREAWKNIPIPSRTTYMRQRAVLTGEFDLNSNPPKFFTIRPISSFSDEELSEMAHRVSHAAEAPFSSVERDPKVVDAGKKLGTASNARAVYDMVQAQMNKESQEVFLVIPIDLHGDPVCPPVEIARGQRDRVTVDMSDVMRPVIAHNASGFVVIHNHPSGHAKPSDADRHLTKNIQKATKAFEPVVLIDHVIVGRREYYSILEDKHYRVK